MRDLWHKGANNELLREACFVALKARQRHGISAKNELLRAKRALCCTSCQSITFRPNDVSACEAHHKARIAPNSSAPVTHFSLNHIKVTIQGAINWTGFEFYGGVTLDGLLGTEWKSGASSVFSDCVSLNYKGAGINPRSH